VSTNTAERYTRNFSQSVKICGCARSSLHRESLGFLGKHNIQESTLFI
jgi:hypothetical protein